MDSNLHLDPALEAQLARLGAERDQPASALLHEAVTQYIARADAKADFLAEAAAGWASFQQDGQHLDQAEAATWLAGWGSESENSHPPCHG